MLACLYKDNLHSICCTITSLWQIEWGFYWPFFPPLTLIVSASSSTSWPSLSIAWNLEQLVVFSFYTHCLELMEVSQGITASWSLLFCNEGDGPILCENYARKATTTQFLSCLCWVVWNWSVAYLQGIVMVEFSMQSCKDIHKHLPLVMLEFCLQSCIYITLLFYCIDVAILLLNIGLSLHKFWVGNSCCIPAGVRVQG